MLKALLALLLLRADASSYGFSVAWNSDSSLVHHARGYAANVVNIPMNDLTTMRNTELEEVHPRGPAVLTNMPDNNPNTTGQNPLSTTDDQPPRLDHDTSVVHHHANDPNSMNHEMLCFRMDNQHGPHTLDGLRPRAPHTTLLRPAQRLGNDPDASHAYICLASPCVHRSHHAIAAPAVSVELSCAIAAPAIMPVELSCAIAAPDLSVELSYAVGIPAHGHSTQHIYCLDSNASAPTPTSTPMSTPTSTPTPTCKPTSTPTSKPTPANTPPPPSTPASTPASPVAALDTRNALTRPPPTPNVMMAITLENPSTNGAATSDPLRPVKRGCSNTSHTATALCTRNVHRLPEPNADMSESMTTTRSGRRRPSTYSVTLPAAMLLPTGTRQVESDITTTVASDPATIVAAQPPNNYCSCTTAGPSPWSSQPRSSAECREGLPNQAPADHAHALTYLAKRSSRCSLQCTPWWHLSRTLACLDPPAAHHASPSSPAACLALPTAHYPSPSPQATRLLSLPSADSPSPPVTRLLGLPQASYASPSPPATHLLGLPSARYASPSPPATRLLGLPSARYASPSPPATCLLTLLSACYAPCAVYYPPPPLLPACPASPSPPSPSARAVPTPPLLPACPASPSPPSPSARAVPSPPLLPSARTAPLLLPLIALAASFLPLPLLEPVASSSPPLLLAPVASPRPRLPPTHAHMHAHAHTRLVRPPLLLMLSAYSPPPSLNATSTSPSPPSLLALSASFTLPLLPAPSASSLPSLVALAAYPLQAPLPAFSALPPTPPELARMLAQPTCAAPHSPPTPPAHAASHLPPMPPARAAPHPAPPMPPARAAPSLPPMPPAQAAASSPPTPPAQAAPYMPPSLHAYTGSSPPPALPTRAFSPPPSQLQPAAASPCTLQPNAQTESKCGAPALPQPAFLLHLPAYGRRCTCLSCRPPVGLRSQSLPTATRRLCICSPKSCRTSPAAIRSAVFPL